MATAIGLNKPRDWAIFTGMGAVGGLLFLGLIAISYNVLNAKYFDGQGAGIATNAIILMAAAVLWRYLCRHRQAISRQTGV